MVFKQGDLDMACGLYATINAIDCILPDGDAQRDARWNFNAAVKLLLGSESPRGPFLDGLFVGDMNKILKHLEVENGTFTVKRPFIREPAKDVSDYFARMHADLAERTDRSAILFYKILAKTNNKANSIFKHWVAVSDAMASRLAIVDSYVTNMQWLIQPECRIIDGPSARADHQYAIWPQSTFVLQRTVN